MTSRPTLRIAVGGVSHETNTFSALPTRLGDFAIHRGAELLQALGVPALPGVEFVPTLWGRAMPGGMVERDAYEQLKGELLAILRTALPVDGVYLALHGAMEAAGVAKAEADLLACVRQAVGPDVPIAASLDLHANLTQSMVDQTQVMAAYRTAPHRDAAETRQRALRLLLRVLREGLRPVSVLIKPPFVLGGDQAISDVEPLASIMQLTREVEALPGMLSAAMLVGCAWTDVPYLTTSVIATAERDATLALEQARRLARAVWERRTQFAYDVPAASIDECIDIALAAPDQTVFITDSGDNPTAGAPGDVPLFIRHMLAKRVSRAVYAVIADAQAVAACQAAGLDHTVTVSVGGKLDTLTCAPLELTGSVRSLARSQDTGHALAVLRVEGVDVVLSSGRDAFTRPEQFHQVGIDPLQFKIVVTKQGYLFSELRAIAPRVLLALSPGMTDQALARLPYRHLPRPVYPLDQDLRWEP